MAEDFEKFAILKNMFRRRSSTEFTGASFDQVLDVEQLPRLLKECGSPKVNPEDIKKQVDLVNPSGSGKLNYEQYDKICRIFQPDTSKTTASLGFKSNSDFET